MSLFPKVFAQTAIQLLGRGVVVAITLLTTAILTRALGASGYGDYVFVTAIVFLFASIADWGTGIISVREAAKTRQSQAKIFGNALTFRFLLSILLFLVFNLVIRILPQFGSLVLPATIASFLLLSLSLRTSFQIVFQTRLRFEKQVLVEIFSSATFLVFLLWAIRALSLPFIFIALAFSSFLASFLGFSLARRLTTFVFRLDKNILRTLFWEALPTGALLFLFSVYNRVDIFILKSIKDASAVGIYGLSYKVHDNLVLGAAYLMGVLLPIISRFAKDHQGKLSLVYKKTFDVLVLSGIIVFLIVFSFSTSIIQIIGGEEFLASSLVLKILVLGTFMAYLNHLTGYTLIALGKQRVSLVVASVAFTFNIVLNLILIPRFSFLGAAAVTVATEGLVFCLTSFYLAKKFALFPSLSFIKTAREFLLTRGKIF